MKARRTTTIPSIPDCRGEGRKENFGEVIESQDRLKDIAWYYRNPKREYAAIAGYLVCDLCVFLFPFSASVVVLPYSSPFQKLHTLQLFARILLLRLRGYL